MTWNWRLSEKINTNKRRSWTRNKQGQELKPKYTNNNQNENKQESGKEKKNRSRPRPR